MMEREVWEASPRSQAAQDVEAMFGAIGNYEDYWLTRDGATNERWRSTDTLVTLERADESEAWRPEYDALEALMGATGQNGGCGRHTLEQTSGERGGGLMGATPELRAVRERLTELGHRALDYERRLRRQERR